MNWSALNSNDNPSRFRFELAMENAIWEREQKKAAAELELFIKLPWKLNQIKMNWMCHILVATTLSTAAARWGKIATSWSFFIWCCCCVEEEVAVKNAKIIHAHANLSGRAQRHTIFFFYSAVANSSSSPRPIALIHAFQRRWISTSAAVKPASETS